MIGAIIGDCVGSKYEFNNIKSKDFEITPKDFEATDDTIMTLAVCDVLQRHVAYDSEEVTDTIRRWARAYPNAGYGGRFLTWALYSDDKKPYNSHGNGSAMRVSACGWYGRDEAEVKALSRAVTEVTHNHPKGIKGAEVTAMCVYYARIGKDKDFIRKYVEQYYSLDFDYEELRRTYVHGEEICDNTVPQAIFCFLISNSFEDCLRTTISIGGDCDTTATISCAIAEAYYKDIPSYFVYNTIKCLPRPKNGCDPRKVVKTFMNDRFEATVTCEDITKDTKFVCCISKTEDREMLDFVYSKSYRALIEFVAYTLANNDFYANREQYPKYKDDCVDIEPVLSYLAFAVGEKGESNVETMKKFMQKANEFLPHGADRFVYLDSAHEALEFMENLSVPGYKIYELIFKETYEIKETK